MTEHQNSYYLADGGLIRGVYNYDVPRQALNELANWAKVCAQGLAQEADRVRFTQAIDALAQTVYVSIADFKEVNFNGLFGSDWQCNVCGHVVPGNDSDALDTHRRYHREVTGAICDYFWGSHGCSVPVEVPHTIHFCGDPGSICCQFDEEADDDHRIRYWDDATFAWGDWKPYGEGFRFVPESDEESGDA